MREIQFKLTREDFVTAFKAHRRSSRLFYVFFFPPVGLIFLAIGVIGLALHLRFCELPLTMGLFLFVVIPYMTNTSLRSALLKRPRMSQTISITASDDGLQIYTHDDDGREKWTDYCAYIETADFFLLYFDSRLYRPIPKRAFRSPAELDEFRNLVVEKIGAVRTGWLL
jgi:hypothetical protein